MSTFAAENWMGMIRVLVFPFYGFISEFIISRFSDSDVGAKPMYTDIKDNDSKR